MNATKTKVLRHVVLPSIVLCVAVTLMLGPIPAFAQDEWDPEQQEVVDAIEAYLEAWNQFDAQALASLCRADCDRIDARGNIYRGRDAILDHYSRVFAVPPPEGIVRSLTYEIFSVRIISPGVAIVDARYTLRSPPPMPEAEPIHGMNTVVLVKTDGRWLRVAHRQRIPPGTIDAGSGR